jgi:predicted outer membrane repeat protein
VAGNSSLAFEAAQFHGNGGRPITTRSPGVTLSVRGSNFTNNTLAFNQLAGSALFSAGGTTVVESCTFINNSVNTSGGAIGMANSTLRLSWSVFKGNKGEWRCYTVT